jgi:outer membrane protein assembly factor BamB
MKPVSRTIRTRVVPAVLALLAVVSGPASVRAADVASSTYQVDPAHDGLVTFSTAFAPPLTQHWSVDLGGPVSYPVVAGNLVIVVAGGPFGTRLAALDIATGKPVWQKLINGVFIDGIGAPHLAYDSGRLFLITASGPLQAFYAATGKALWLTRLPEQVTFNYVPVAANGYVYAAGDADGGDIYQVSESSGALGWIRQYSGGGGGLTLGGGNIYALMSADLPALSLSDGKQVWYNRINSGFYGIAAYYRGILYCPDLSSGTSGGRFAADSGKTTGHWVYGLPAFSGNLAYIAGNKSIVALNIASPGAKWKFQANEQFSLPPITINGNVYTLSTAGTLFVNDGNSGKLLQSVKIGLGSAAKPSGALASGLGAGQGLLFVPSGTTLSAFGP